MNGDNISMGVLAKDPWQFTPERKARVMKAQTRKRTLRAAVVAAVLTAGLLTSGCTMPTPGGPVAAMGGVGFSIGSHH
ncbi:hypothetical protein MNVI_07250 [Mycobacterium noviomagense]|uniref:Uncharacterized protein n=1 Tax=Mycobacterium noviomagense TaxID=459858 RepID=A0A7I7P9Z4_9MYCO|nr:hypothetical protein MNVI_07250 [Mycobacterium noviomagense]